MATNRRGPTLGQDNNPGNAKWCPEHQTLECTKQRNKGRGICHARAVRGTNVCKLHGGQKLAELVAKGKANIVMKMPAEVTAWNPTGPTSVDPSVAAMSVLQMSWLRLGTYSELLRQQVAKEGDTAGGTGEYDPKASGLIGFRYGMGGKEGISYVQSEEVRALVTLEAAERDRVVKYAKTAHDMGVSDKMINLAERWGDIIAVRISLMLEGLMLTAEQEMRVPALIQAHLGSVDLAAIGAGDVTP